MSEVRVGEWSGVENRKHKRVPLRVPIECASAQTVLRAQAENISVSGLLVRCADPLPPDTELSVQFTLPGSNYVIRSSARVAHIVPGVFMGLELLSPAQESLHQVEMFIASSPATPAPAAHPARTPFARSK